MTDDRTRALAGEVNQEAARSTREAGSGPTDDELLGVLNAARIALKSRDQSSFEMRVLGGIKAAIAKLEAKTSMRPSPPQCDPDLTRLVDGITRAICCPEGCQLLGDSEDGEKCYCDTSDLDGSGIEKKALAVLSILVSHQSASVKGEDAPVAWQWRSPDGWIQVPSHRDINDLRDAGYELRPVSALPAEQGLPDSTDHIDWDVLAEERLGQRPRSSTGSDTP